MPFDSSDWEPASSYTDDSMAKTAVRAAKAATDKATVATASAEKAITDSAKAQSAAESAGDLAASATATAKETAQALSSMVRTTAAGIEVGRSADGKTYETMRARMSTDGAFQIVDKAGKVLANFDADSVDLGVGLPQSEVTLCGGAGRMHAVYASQEQTEWREIAELYLKANGGVVLQTKQGGDTGLGITENRLGDVTVRISADDFEVSLPSLADKPGDSSRVSFIDLAKDTGEVKLADVHDSDGTWTVVARRVGKMVTIRFSSYGSWGLSNDQGYREIFTVPEKFRPESRAHAPLSMLSDTPTNGAFTIDSAGKLKCWASGDGGRYFLGSTSYFAARGF